MLSVTTELTKYTLELWMMMIMMIATWECCIKDFFYVIPVRKQIGNSLLSASYCQGTQYKTLQFIKAYIHTYIQRCILQGFDYRDMRLADDAPPVRKTTVYCAATSVPSVMGGDYKNEPRCSL